MAPLVRRLLGSQLVKRLLGLGSQLVKQTKHNIKHHTHVVHARTQAQASHTHRPPDNIHTHTYTHEHTTTDRPLHLACL